MRTIYLQKHELKILKYIKKNAPVSEPELINKFDDFEHDKNYISSLIDRRDLNEEERKHREDKYYQSLDKNIPVGQQKTYEQDFEDNPYHVLYSLSREGQQYFDEKRKESWSRWFPYVITTILAASSVIIQILNFICEHCNKGTP